MIGKWEGITAAAAATRTEYCKITSFFFFAFSFYGFCFLLLCITFAFASNDSLMTFKPIQPGLPFTHSTEYGVDVKTKVRIEFHLCIQYFFFCIGKISKTYSRCNDDAEKQLWVQAQRMSVGVHRSTTHLRVCVFVYKYTFAANAHTLCSK